MSHLLEPLSLCSLSLPVLPTQIGHKEASVIMEAKQSRLLRDLRGEGCE